MLRVHLNRAILLLLGLVILSGCGGGDDRVTLRGGTEHFPLLDGRVMRYREQTREGETTFELHMRYAGGKDVRVFPLLFKGGMDRGHCFLRSKGPCVYFSTDKPLTALSSLAEYRELWVDETAKQGDEWEDMDTGSTTTFEGFETITVPAGTYDNCYKTTSVISPAFMDSLDAWRERGEITVEEYEDWAQDANNRTTRWFSAGVGLVKEVIRGREIVRELVAVEKTGTGKVDIDTTQVDE